MDVRTLVWKLQAAMTSVFHWDIADARSGVIESATPRSLVADHASHFVPLDISACEDPLTSTLAVVPTSAPDVSSTVSFLTSLCGSQKRERQISGSMFEF